MNPFDPMPTIKAILGMPIYEAVKESQILAHLDDFEAPQCELRLHDIGENHSGPAGFFALTPCHHHETYVCTTYVVFVSALDVMTCYTCRLKSPITDFSFIPIGGNK